MANWELQCPNCQKKFIYLRIEDDLESFYIPKRPMFPDNGLNVECPSCGSKTAYTRYSLTIGK